MGFYILLFHRILPRATCSSQTIFHSAALQTEASSDVNSSSITCLISKDTFGGSRTQSLFLKQPLNKYSFSLHALVTSKPQDVSASYLIGEGKIGVLLLNLGGPETLDDVQPFLFNLFADPVNFSLLRTSVSILFSILFHYTCAQLCQNWHAFIKQLTGYYSSAKIVLLSSKAFGAIYIRCQSTKEQGRLCCNWWRFSSSADN